MSNITESERLTMLALAQELDDAKYTRAAISHEFGQTTEDDHSAQPDLVPRLTGLLDRESTMAAAQLGPWDTGYFTFGGGVAVGGYANLTLHQNGAYNFSGHFHVSGAISYNTSFVWPCGRAQCPPPSTHLPTLDEFMGPSNPDPVTTTGGSQRSTLR